MCVHVCTCVFAMFVVSGFVNVCVCVHVVYVCVYVGTCAHMVPVWLYSI